MAALKPQMIEIAGRKYVARPGMEVVHLYISRAKGGAIDSRTGEPYRVPAGKTFTALQAQVHHGGYVDRHGRGGGTPGYFSILDRDNPELTQTEADAMSRQQRRDYGAAGKAQVRYQMQVARDEHFRLTLHIVFQAGKYVVLGSQYSVSGDLLGVEG